MGYYTAYEFAIYKNNSTKTEEEIKKEVVSIMEELDLINYVFDMELGFYETAKWYEHDEDMKMISSKIQDVVFELSGEGEEVGDIWKSYYLNGKMQRIVAQITFEDFDENKLE